MTTATAVIGLAELEELADVASDLVDVIERFRWSPEGENFADDVLDQLNNLPTATVLEPASWQVLYSLTTGSPSLRRDVRILRDVLAIAQREGDV